MPHLRPSVPVFSPPPAPGYRYSDSSAKINLCVILLLLSLLVLQQILSALLLLILLIPLILLLHHRINPARRVPRPQPPPSSQSKYRNIRKQSIVNTTNYTMPCMPKHKVAAPTPVAMLSPAANMPKTNDGGMNTTGSNTPVHHAVSRASCTLFRLY